MGSLLGRSRGSQVNLDIFTETTNHEGIDRVGLFQKAVPLGKVTHLARVYDADRNSRHAVPDNYNRLDAFVTEATKLWLHQLRRRSQKGRLATAVPIAIPGAAHFPVWDQTLRRRAQRAGGSWPEL